MLTKDSPNFTVWNRVFEKALSNRTDGLLLDGETILVHEGANADSYPEVSVLGVFVLSDGRSVSISFRHEASWDEINEIEVEVQENFKDLKAVTSGEKQLIESKNQ